MNRDEAMHALDSTDWTGATVEHGPRRSSFVYSVRVPNDLSELLDAEATRRGVTPSALIRDLVSAGLYAATDETVVTLRVADIHRAIDSAIRAAA